MDPVYLGIRGTTFLYIHISCRYLLCFQSFWNKFVQWEEINKMTGCQFKKKTSFLLFWKESSIHIFKNKYFLCQNTSENVWWRNCAKRNFVYPNCHSLGLLWLPWALLSLYPVQKTKTKQEQQLKVILLTIAKMHLEDYILGRFFFYYITLIRVLFHLPLVLGDRDYLAVPGGTHKKTLSSLSLAENQKDANLR